MMEYKDVCMGGYFCYNDLVFIKQGNIATRVTSLYSASIDRFARNSHPPLKLSGTSIVEPLIGVPIRIVVANVPQKTIYVNKFGSLHRIDGPAQEYVEGQTEWWINGQRHREDGPAIISSYGNKKWYQNDTLHRVDGPAIEWTDGGKEWYQYGNRHRLDGPAIIGASGDQEWWIDGVRADKFTATVLAYEYENR